MLRIKICGITKPEQGCAIVQMGATALGFICVPASKRYISPEQINRISSHPTLLTIDRIGVFANTTIKEICQVVELTNLTAIQLHGDESPEFCRSLRDILPNIEIIKALRISSAEALKQADNYSKEVDTLLLDAYDPQMLGGTGKTLDWQNLKKFSPNLPWFLAGGLTPDNVEVALQQTKPNGIDLSSGVEKVPGDKDLRKVAQLFEKLKQSGVSL
ncbi:MAG TPA: phosphoribosylanthranilate isomerase [Halomicronema sp.]